MVAESIKPIKVFYSYAHEDSDLRERLERHLSPMRRLRRITGWFDRDIQAGAEWSHQIEQHLNEADIILLLISPDFVSSDYCYSVEMQRALERYEAGEARVVPILLRPVDWQETPIGRLQVLPSNAQPVTRWSDPDQAFLDIVRGIRELIKDLLLKKALSKQETDALFPESEEHSAQPRSLVPSRSLSPSSRSSVISAQHDSSTMPDSFFFSLHHLVESRSSTIEQQISTPSLVILVGNRPSDTTAYVLKNRLLMLKPNAQHRVALVYINSPLNPLNEYEKEFIARKGPYDFVLQFLLEIDIPSWFPIMERVDTKDQHMFIRDWVPKPGVVTRNHGHVAACLHYKYIYNTVYSALNSILKAANKQDKAELQEVQVNVVVDLGDVFASGMLPDIASIVHELLRTHQCTYRLNLFCTLPGVPEQNSVIEHSTQDESEQREVDLDKWLKGLTTACLLELLAFNDAAPDEPKGVYKKYMRGNVQYLTRGQIAHEIYLFQEHPVPGAKPSVHFAVATDLFQRITDASGVGLLEHSRWVDRMNLTGRDDRSLPTKFGITYAFEVRFPADETALAFAQISTARLLPLLKGIEFWPQEAEVERLARELEQKGKESVTA